MGIVLNEYNWAREMIAAHDLGKKPYETLCRVARYYLNVRHCTTKETRRMLDRFLIECDPTASLPKWAATLDHAMVAAKKRDGIEIDSITITLPEIETIETLETKPLKRLAFTLLCLAKYWSTKDSEIMRMANISTSLKRQSELYRTLFERGLVKFSKKVDNTNVQVCFVQGGATALEVTDFRNLGWQYLKYQGGPFFECYNCGLTVKYSDPVHGKHQRYCKDCAIKIRTQQSVNAVMKRRHYG